MTTARLRRCSRIIAAFLALALLAPTAAPAEAQPNLGSLMRQKLDRAQQLFEAVVLARFPAVGRHAGEPAPHQRGVDVDGVADDRLRAPGRRVPGGGA